ncbi:hypothetical protein IAQ61_007609 [Plenodomus lingam]|uniref:uncharacterized protein n=1 Tax=Leptosphaeria maculans TaxID=5022 RepID=UPI003333E958|nr:hypothetical protein IAQ61_007609 [Plenodomus lingam]
MARTAGASGIIAHELYKARSSVPIPMVLVCPIHGRHVERLRFEERAGLDKSGRGGGARTEIGSATKCIRLGRVDSRRVR